MTGIILTRPITVGGGGSGDSFGTLVLDTGSVTANGVSDTLYVVGGNAIITAGSGSPNTVTIHVDPSAIELGDLGDVDTTGATSGSLLGFNGVTWTPVGQPIQVSIINGQPVMTFVDPTRGIGSPPIGKRLSVTDQLIIFSENQLSNDDWLDIGNAIDADSGYIMEFDGTVTYATAHCEDTGAESKNIHLFINNTDLGSIGSLVGGANASFINNTLDIDFSQGDKIRLQAKAGSAGIIQDTVVKLTVKWRE